MKRLPIFLSIVAIFFLYGFLVPGGSGFAFECINYECRYVASSTMNGTLFGPILGLAIFFIPRKNIIENVSTPVGVLRRLGAMYINMFAVMIPIMSIAVLPILIIEGMHSGEFQWSFYREFSRSTDAIAGTATVLFVFGMILYYYYRSLKVRRPTIGQYLMGYYISGNDEEWTTKRAWGRLGWTMLTLSVWPVSAIIAVRHPQKAFWFDLRTNSLAVRFDYINNDLKSTRSEASDI